MVCVSFMLLGVGSLIIFTSVVGFLGKVKKIRCLLVTVSVNQTPDVINLFEMWVKPECSCLDVVFKKQANRKILLD